MSVSRETNVSETLEGASVRSKAVESAQTTDRRSPGTHRSGRPSVERHAGSGDLRTTGTAILIVSFGGPEQPEDIVPFLERVTHGRRIPKERLLEVAGHYNHFGGVSPHNGQVRELIDALKRELDQNDLQLPVYWGNRNWHPLLTDTVRAMTQDGVRRAFAFILSAYSSYSGCRQYLENIAASRAEIGPNAPQIDKIRAFYNHPDFIDANAERLREALDRLSAEEQQCVPIVYTAHSIPQSMSDSCDYVQQLTETCRLVSEAVGIETDRWTLVYQSRSGRPTDPWLEPDILDHLRTLPEQDVTDVVVLPIGFLSDHLEVLYDLDFEAQQLCDQIGLRMIRADTVGTHASFVTMIRKLIQERMSGASERCAMGRFGPSPDVCPADCCPAPARRQRPRGP